MEEKKHVVVFPYPGQGHINPLMQLSLRLSSMGFFVTFVTAAGNHRSIKDSWAKQGMTSSSSERIHMASIPDDMLPPRTMGGMFEFLEGTKKLQAPLEEFMEKLQVDSTYPPVSCIVSDTILLWVSNVAKKFGVHWVPFFPLPTAAFMVFHHASALAAQGLLGGDEIIQIPGLAPLHPLEIPSMLGNPNDVEQNWSKELSQLTKDAPWLFINTCESVEHEALEAARAQGFNNIIPVAPLLPASFVEPSHGSEELVTSSLWTQDTSCMEWLDMQLPRSVLYVSFGSISGMLFGDLEKLLSGILRSGVKFLWVLRRDLLLEVTEEKYQDFVTRAKDHGMIVNWAPQLRVLLHPSIAAFMTHCGWNSTFESICAGVPMICWPCFAEQKMNAKYIEDVWEVGIKVAKTNNLTGNVTEEQVERVVVEVVKGETGKKLKDRVTELRSACKDFAEKNGLKAFADTLKRQ